MILFPKKKNHRNKKKRQMKRSEFADTNAKIKKKSAKLGGSHKASAQKKPKDYGIIKRKKKLRYLFFFLFSLRHLFRFLLVF
jgi:hypothetical protein